MEYLERYERNRNMWQMSTNYAACIGSLFFALQNLSTNWGGSYLDDPSLTAAVQNSKLAGTAWDERYLQVGSLQLAFCVFVFGLEMQGILSPGRYKRIMTWCVNFPTAVFLVGNLVLAVRRHDDGIQDSVTWDAVFAVVFWLLAIANTVYYVVNDTYKNEAFFLLLDDLHQDGWNLPATPPKHWRNNRFWFTFGLHIAATILLLYFCIAGLAYYDADKGFMLTSLYKANPDAVTTWDAAGGTVGIWALPLILMLLMLELQGDLTPSNYKTITVWASCMNIFVTSIFMYATHWDAYDNGVITSHILPLVCMIILCVWAIACIVSFAIVPTYVDAYWVKILADPWPTQPVKMDIEAPQWRPEPIPEPKPAPIVPSEDTIATIVRRAEADAKPAAPAPAPTPAPAPAPVPAPEPVDDIAPIPIERAPLHPTVEEEDLCDIIVGWDAPARTRPKDIEYKITITDLDDDNNTFDTAILPGTQRRYMIDEYAGEPIIPDEDFIVNVEWRFKGDADAPDGGWQGASGNTNVRTAPMPHAAALLRSRVPRIHLREVLTFNSNKDTIKGGAAALPEVARIMRENPELTLGVDGHVNFGQKPHAAIELSAARAKNVCHRLRDLGVDLSRLVPQGLGYERPRYPRGTKFASRNRRVEFRVLPGSPLFERLAAEAEARRRQVNGVAMAESFSVPGSTLHAS